jgi:hypothetical protein
MFDPHERTPVPRVPVWLLNFLEKLDFFDEERGREVTVNARPRCVFLALLP